MKHTDIYYVSIQKRNKKYIKEEYIYKTDNLYKFIKYVIDKGV